MNGHRRMFGAFAVVCFVCTSTYSLDSAVVSDTRPINLAPVVGASPVVDAEQPAKIESFQVLQRKYLKTVIVTNLMYAAGFGLYRGVVLPRYREVDGMDETLKLMPLNILSGAMMYVSLPMSAVTSYKARNNYRHYYKEAPRNLTMPLLFAGVGLLIGATGINYWQMYKDYRDNDEIDNSYTKYNNAMYAILDAGTITWIGTNLYSLGYIVALGRMAEKKTAPISMKIVPFRYRSANGLAVVCDF